MSEPTGERAPDLIGGEIELLDVVNDPGRGGQVTEDLVRRRRRQPLRVVRDSTTHRLLTLLGPTAVALIAAAAIFALPVLEGRLFTRIVALTVVLWGLDVQLGLGGQLSLGHGAFVGVGAYTAALSLGTAGLPFPAALALAAAAGFVAGLLIGLPALRIQGQYLAMVTLGAAVAFPFVIRRFAWLTGGSNGPQIDYQFVPPAWLGLEARHYHRWTHLLICAIALAIYFVVRRIVAGPLGREIRAVAHDPAAATTFGIRVGVVRIVTVAVSAAVAAVGGALLIFATPAVTADSYDLFFSLSLYAVAVFGGIGTLGGSFLGAALLVGAPWAVSQFGWRIEPELLAGVVLIVFTLRGRNGVVGLIEPYLADRIEIIEPERAEAG